MQAEFIYKNAAHAAWIQFYGEYPSKALESALIEVGWQRPLHPPTRIEAKYLCPTDETGSMRQPRDPNGFFGAPTPENGKAAIRAAKAVLKRFGVEVRGPRKQSFQEAI